VVAQVVVVMEIVKGQLLMLLALVHLGKETLGELTPLMEAVAEAVVALGPQVKLFLEIKAVQAATVFNTILAAPTPIMLAAEGVATTTILPERQT
jgi:hypothetical protein